MNANKYNMPINDILTTTLNIYIYIYLYILFLGVLLVTAIVLNQKYKT